MKKTLKLSFLILLSSANFCQSQEVDKTRAIESVKQYISSQLSSAEEYVPIKFHEIFVQSYGESIAEKKGCPDSIVFSVSHSYKIDDQLIEFDYFHLNSAYRVICKSTADDMMDDDLFSSENIEAVLENLKRTKGMPIDSVMHVEELNFVKLEQPVITFCLTCQTKKDSNGNIVAPFVNKGQFEIIFSRSDFLSYLNERFLEGSVMHSSTSTARKIGVQLYKTLKEEASDVIHLAEVISGIIKSEKGYNQQDISTVEFMIMESFYQELFTRGSFNVKHIGSNAVISKFMKEIKETEYEEFIKTETWFYAEIDEEKKLVKTFTKDDYTAK